MAFDEVFLYYPRGTATGGPELLHQTCDLLRRAGQPAYLVPTAATRDLPRAAAYAGYDAPEREAPTDAPGSAVVVPENTGGRELRHLRHATEYLWWLSIDFAPWYRWTRQRSAMAALRVVTGEPAPWRHRAMAVPLGAAERLRRTRLARDPRVHHLAQSVYAARRVSADLGVAPQLLTDFVSGAASPFANDERAEAVIAYNAAKGGDLVELVAARAPRSWRFVPVAGLDRDGVSRLLRTATVYLDLGHQPGRDRLPREAARAGAVVVVAARGAAALAEDCPLPARHRLLFDAGLLDRTVAVLGEVLADPEPAVADQREYRRWVAGDRHRFETELHAVFDLPPASGPGT